MNDYISNKKTASTILLLFPVFALRQPVYGVLTTRNLKLHRERETFIKILITGYIRLEKAALEEGGR